MSPDAELDLALGRKAGVALDHPVCDVSSWPIAAVPNDQANVGY
jgi:hypothetical protein